MANKFTLDQLQYANEVCFQDDFVRLFNKYAINTELTGLGGYYMRDMKHRQRNLIDFIFTFSREDRHKEIGLIIEGMLVELIGDYQK